MTVPGKTQGKSKSVPGKSAAKGSPAAKEDQPPGTFSVEFRLYAPEAQEVCLAGDFSGWLPEKCLMRRLKDGSWGKKLKLPPGRYEYRFVVDGHWWTDPENPHRQCNPFGQDNSVLIVP